MPRTIVSRSLASTRSMVSGRSSGSAAIVSVAAPAISNVRAIDITETSVAIAWDLDQYGTGQVNYGTTASYGSSTTLEPSFNYRSHNQAITGLSAGTLYHYRVRSSNVNAQETVGGDNTFTTLAAVTYPSVTTLTSVALNSDTMPTYLGTITDSTWGTQVKRVTNTAGHAPNIGKQMAWNADGTQLLVHQGNRNILSTVDYSYLGTASTPGKCDYPIFSSITANRMYGADDGLSTGTGQLWVLNTTTFVWSSLADFRAGSISGQTRAYNYVAIGDYEGNISNDDHLIALMCNTVANKSGQWDVIAYDPISNVVRGTLTNLGAAPSECGVSQSGQYVYVNGTGDGTGTFQGCRLYTYAMSLVRQVVSYRPHLDMGYDTSGNEVLVNAQAGNMHRLSDGTVTDLMPGATTAGIDGGHVSCRNLDQPGWCYVSDAQSSLSTRRGFGQVYAVKLDGSGDVRVYGCHHEVADLANNGNYAIPNRNGTKVFVASRWGGSSLYGFMFGRSV